MSGSARQSYYEIALTNRQVLTVFVFLLVSVLAAFLAGVWVGKRAPSAQVETVEARAIEAATEPGSEPLARLDFFSRDGEKDGDPTVDAEPAPIEAEPAPPAQADPAPKAPVEPPPKPEPAAAKQPAATPPAQPVVAEAPAAKAPAPPAPTPAAAPAAGTLVVQVFSSNNQVQAQSVVDKLREGGFPALLSPVEVSGRTMYRVRIGPYADRQVAEGIAEQVRRDFRLETWITE